jgi:hypothetical protein
MERLILSKNIDATMPSILTEIIGENGLSKHKFKVEGNKIVVKSSKKGRGHTEYAPTFTKDCLLPYRKGIGPIKWLSQKLMLMDGADKCIEFHDKSVEIPRYDRSTVRKLFDAEVLQKAGTVNVKLVVPTILYLLLGAIMMLIVVSIMIQTGRLKI